MARGKKTPPETVTAIMAVQAVTDNAAETARILGLPGTTVSDIIERNKNSEEFEKLRAQKKNEFAERATAIINKALERLENTIDDPEINIPVNQLVIAIGTLYDKRALSENQATENLRIDTDVDIGKLAELAGYRR